MSEGSHERAYYADGRGDKALGKAIALEAYSQLFIGKVHEMVQRGDIPEHAGNEFIEEVKLMFEDTAKSELEHRAKTHGNVHLDPSPLNRRNKHGWFDANVRHLLDLFTTFSEKWHVTPEVLEDIMYGSGWRQKLRDQVSDDPSIRDEYRAFPVNGLDVEGRQIEWALEAETLEEPRHLLVRRVGDVLDGEDRDELPGMLKNLFHDAWFTNFYVWKPLAELGIMEAATHIAERLSNETVRARAQDLFHRKEALLRKRPSYKLDETMKLQDAIDRVKTFYGGADFLQEASALADDIAELFVELSIGNEEQLVEHFLDEDEVDESRSFAQKKSEVLQQERDRMLGHLIGIAT